MTSDEVRKKYLEFFEKKGHKIIDPAPLVLEGDDSTLFTSAGMQPLVPFLLGERHPQGKRLTNSQPSIRLGDIEEVGDNRHLTFFEMLGNWSLGDYFKERQLPLVWEFLTSELKLDPKRLYLTVYSGDEKFGVPRDNEAVKIWKEILNKEDLESKDVEKASENGMQGGRIFYYGKENWWSLTGTPDKMEIGHIGGPDSEIFYEFPQVEHDPKYGKHCHPNCDCGRFLEIGNSVFIQYKKISDSQLEELKQKNVDFGGGLERITAAKNDNPDVFSIDLFDPVIEQLEKDLDVKYGQNSKESRMLRIVAEHMRASVFLLNLGIKPGNKLHGYVLRRLIRRAVRMTYYLDKNFDSKKFRSLVRVVINAYPTYLNKDKQNAIEEEISSEVEKFRGTIERGIKLIEKLETVDAKKAFDLYQTYGFPLEITKEILEEREQKIDEEAFRKEFEKHKNKSRTSSAGVFKGGLADHSPEVIKLHTATHLLLASLRKVLGEHVVQKGQNITKDRARFDFPNEGKLSDEQLKEIEDMVNGVIEKSLPVNFQVLPKEEAIKTGAIHAFNEKYADTVKVYFVGKSLDEAFSKEFCGGPHVKNTNEIGHVRIKKQEKIGSGLIRIYLVRV